MVGIEIRALLASFCLSAAAVAQPLQSPASEGVAPPARGVQEQQAKVPPGHTALPDTATPAVAPASAGTPKTDWYGWQTLVVDAHALLLVGIGLEIREGEAPALGGLLVYGLGGPLVHLVHERPGAALGSLALRAGIPIVFALAGAGANENCGGASSESDGSCAIGGAVAWGVVGMGVAAIVDAAFLGREKREEVPPNAVALTSVAPTVDPARRTAGISLLGTF
jgi:hypothetical protein